VSFALLIQMKGRIINIINGAFILLFVYTAFSKLYELRQFRFVLNMSPLLKNYSGQLSVGVPVMELCIALVRFIPATARLGMIAGICLLVIFTAYIIYMILIDPHLPCSCGGVIQQLSWTQHIVFNLFFITAGIISIYMQRENLKKPRNL
jgi:putative oxidoreductase